MTELAAEAIEKFRSHRARVGVLGLGYAGLPLACCFAEAGLVTVGFDVDESKVCELRAGRSYIGHISSDRLGACVRSGKLIPTSSFEELARCDAAIICVPTPLGEGRAPDLTFVVETTKQVARYVHRGQLVVLESTTYPGTTEEVAQGLIAKTGMVPGKDYFLAFSPEREDPANSDFHTRTIPKIVGGVTKDCLDVACAAYGQVVEQPVPVSSARVAEAAKLLENIYRCVNIALVNELKLLFTRMGIDVWEVVAAASTKPFGFSSFYPGPGLGGHCIPIDPFYLTWKARQYDFPTRFIELAGEINGAMPAYVVERLAEGLNLQGKALKDSEVLLLGVAYKRDIEDTRESPALAIIKLLAAKLARVQYHDPHVPMLRSRHLAHDMHSVALTPETLERSDAAIIVTDHRIVDYRMVVKHAKLVVDTRNVTAGCRGDGHNVILA
jgi:UDP-N-acetyl-D-glucosamine dehydrogenase